MLQELRHTVSQSSYEITLNWAVQLSTIILSRDPLSSSHPPPKKKKQKQNQLHLKPWIFSSGA